MQGRLIGKRFQAEYFVDGAHEETHGCDYLLANDIDMEPVPGYAAASWEKGLRRLRHEARHGDAAAHAVAARAPRWCSADVLDHHHHDDRRIRRAPC